MADINNSSNESGSKNIIDTYQEMPYDSYPYAATDPSHLMTLGVLFGMNPTLPEEARILEIGCGEGGNLIPYAINYPKAKLVGVDISKTQIEIASKQAKDLELKNITFHSYSITDIDDSFGKFDYIICHGVISWVPEAVEQKIFQICKQHLTENGIAYISYNALPGWNMSRTIRDMMLYHSSIFSETKEKVSQAKLLLEFIKDSLEGVNSPYAAMLRAESNMLANYSDSYLRHDYLGDNNKPYYFTDFITNAAKYNLQYLSDSNLLTMYIGNMPAKVVEKLQGLNNIIRVTQYMDFINNCRFKATLLCHDSVKLNRNLNGQDITKFYIAASASLYPEKELADIDVNNTKENLKFFYNQEAPEVNLSTSSPYMKAALYSLIEQRNNFISFDQLMSNSLQKLKAGEEAITKVKEEFLNTAMELLLHGYVEITMQKPREKANLTKPKAAKFAAYKIMNSRNEWVTNLRHQAVMLSLLERYVLIHANGKNNHKQIVEALMKHIENKEILVNSNNGTNILTPEEIRKVLEQQIGGVIRQLNDKALLV